MTKKHVDIDVPSIRHVASILGEEWVGIFESPVEFKNVHFEQAMTNLIRQPNINSTVILRADILKENKYEYGGDEAEPQVTVFESEMAHQRPEIPSNSSDEFILEKNLDDIEVQKVPLKLNFKPKIEIVRRIIPRNPFKDYIINQTCLISVLPNDKYDDSMLIIYIPHIEHPDDTPFYLPPVKGIAILYHEGNLSLHYLPFDYQNPEAVSAMKRLDPSTRPIRIAYRLLQTAQKHSNGVMNGYEKRVQHDVVVSKVAFQDRYIALKKKYSQHLVESWVESTDPRKHVFEDIAIAAFLIEYWSIVYKSKEDFEFRDLGCGNGLLVYLLTLEGYKGIGIDARARKSWAVYPDNIRSRLKEQVIIPSILLRPHPAVRNYVPTMSDNGRIFQVPFLPSQSSSQTNTDSPYFAYYSSASLLRSPNVNTAEFPRNTFIIGNHSDELTCWIPLFGYPFLVIPCCSHALSGAKVRYSPKSKIQARLSSNDTDNSEKNTKTNQVASSTYASLVDHVEDLAKEVGWKVEREMLRIPSTRNAAIIGFEKVSNSSTPIKSIFDILALEGGAEGWVENTMSLMKKAPRSH